MSSTYVEHYSLPDLLSICTFPWASNPHYARCRAESSAWIEGFNFLEHIPKLVIYDNKRDLLSEEDAILLIFMNLIGVDIVILTPTNYNNIEDLVSENVFEVHQLSNANFDITQRELERKINGFNKKNFLKNTISKLAERIIS